MLPFFYCHSHSDCHCPCHGCEDPFGGEEPLAPTAPDSSRQDNPQSHSPQHNRVVSASAQGSSRGWNPFTCAAIIQQRPFWPLLRSRLRSLWTRKRCQAAEETLNSLAAKHLAIKLTEPVQIPIRRRLVVNKAGGMLILTKQIIILVNLHDCRNKLFIRGIIHGIDIRAWRKVFRNRRIAPINWNRPRQQGI